MTNSIAILTIDEVRQALDLDQDSISDGDAQRISQQASDFICHRTGKDWGTTNNIAKTCAEFVCIDLFNRESDHKSIIDALLSDLIDIKRREESYGETR